MKVLKLNLKNAAVIITCLATVAVFTSCKKEGVYNPNKKIKRISEQQNNTGAKLPTQEWTWDKKLLTKVDYYSGNRISNTERFTYEKKRLTKVEGDNYYYKITYDGSKYKKMELFSMAGQLGYSYDFVYDKNKISKVTMTEYDYDNYGDYSVAKSGFMASIFPDEVLRSMEKSANDENRKANRKASTYMYTVTYTYDGNNLKEVVWERSEEDYLYRETLKYDTYDKKINPRYNALYEGGNDVLSKNNPTEATISVYTKNGSYTYTGTIKLQWNYIYDKNVPTEIERKSIDEDGDVSITRTFYEYE